MKDKMGNPESERRAEFYQQSWCHEAVPRYFYSKVLRASANSMSSVIAVSLQVAQRKMELEQAMGIKHP